MKWRKLGQIFCPDRVSETMVSHAAIPFAEHISDSIYRIYFTSRDAHRRSYTHSLVIDLHYPRKILDFGVHPILVPGGPGEFDDSGAMASCMVSYKGEQRMYYTGWNLTATVPFRYAIGLAKRNKEGRWERFGPGPIMDRMIHEPLLCASGCVLADEQAGIWRMWYASGVRWIKEGAGYKHFYHLKYAESLDGEIWRQTGRVAIDFASTHEYALSRPTVVKDAMGFHMWFSHRGDKYRIGYASSYDGVNWQRDDQKAGIDVSESGWDSDMIEYPHVFVHKGQRYMLYNGNDYGRTGFGLAVAE